MNIDVNKYPVRRSNPIVAGSYGLPKDTQRYVIKGQSLIGLDLDKGDILYLKNLEGNQICEIKRGYSQLFTLLDNGRCADGQIRMNGFHGGAIIFQ